MIQIQAGAGWHPFLGNFCNISGCPDVRWLLEMPKVARLAPSDFSNLRV